MVSKLTDRDKKYIAPGLVHIMERLDLKFRGHVRDKDVDAASETLAEMKHVRKDITSYLGQGVSVSDNYLELNRISMEGHAKDIELLQGGKR